MSIYDVLFGLTVVLQCGGWACLLLGLANYERPDPIRTYLEDQLRAERRVRETFPG